MSIDRQAKCAPVKQTHQAMSAIWRASFDKKVDSYEIMNIYGTPFESDKNIMAFARLQYDFVPLVKSIFFANKASL